MSQTLQSVLCVTTNKYLVRVLVVLLHACFSVVSPIPFLLAAIFFSGHPYIGSTTVLLDNNYYEHLLCRCRWVQIETEKNPVFTEKELRLFSCALSHILHCNDYSDPYFTPEQWQIIESERKMLCRAILEGKEKDCVK